MNPVAIAACCLLAAVLLNAQEKAKLPATLELYVNNSKAEMKINSTVAEIAKQFVDKKLKEEEKTLIWALKSSNITAIEGVKRAGLLVIFFTAKVAECPSETQKNQTKTVWLFFTVPMGDAAKDSCSAESMRVNRSCALQHRAKLGTTNIQCTVQ